MRFLKYILIFAFVAVAIYGLSTIADHAKAADIVWDGGGADNLASTKENWVGNVVPATSDAIIFDGTSDKKCIIDVTFVQSGENIIKATWLKLNSGYDGTVYLNYTAYFSIAVEINSGTLNQSSSFQAVYGMKQTDGTWYLNANAANYADYYGYGFTQTGGLFICGPNGRIYNNESFSITGGTNINAKVYQAGNGNFNTGIQIIYSLNMSGIGTIIQTGPINIGNGGFFLYGATFTASTTHYVTCNGDFNFISGTITHYKINLIMTGASYLNWNSLANGSARSINITGNVITIYPMWTFQLNVDGTLTTSSTIALQWSGSSSVGQSSIKGTIQGTGSAIFYIVENTYSDIEINKCLLSNTTFRFGESNIMCNWTIPSTITKLYFEHYTSPYIVNINDFYLTTTSFTIHERIFFNETLTIMGKWYGNIYYDAQNSFFNDQQHWAGWLYTDNDVNIVYNTVVYLQMAHNEMLGLQINSWSGTNNFTFNVTGIEENVQFAVSRLIGSAIYDIYKNGIYMESIEASPSGIVGFTTDVTTGDYLVSRSTAIFTDDSQFGIWMILIFFLILTIISFVAYAMHIGLLNIITLIIMMIAIPLSNDLWTEYWPFVLMFGLVNAILVLMTWMRR